MVWCVKFRAFLFRLFVWFGEKAIKWAWDEVDADKNGEISRKEVADAASRLRVIFQGKRK